MKLSLKRILVFLILALGFSVGCATTEVTPTGLTLITQSEYEKVLDLYTDRIETYNGLYNSLQAAASLINSKVLAAQIEQNARIYQWDQTKLNAERGSQMEKQIKGADVFLSFYTPEKKHDELHKSNTMWKIFLDVNGRRYEGKATKIKLQTVEVQGLYPYHNRFSTPYTLSFPISVRDIEKFPSKLTLTGPAGSATLEFPAIN